MNLRIAIQAAAGIVCTLFFLGVALHRVPPGAVAASLADANPSWVGVAMLCYAVDLALRIWRWQVILRPIAAVPLRVVGKSLVVGYGLNVIMPARLGELMRAEFLNKIWGLARVWALTSIVVERLFDGLAVVGLLGTGLLLAALTRQLSGALVGLLVTASAIFGAGFVAALCLAGSLTSRAFARFPRILAQLTMVQRGLGILRSRRILKVVALTLMVYGPEALAMWFAVKAAGMTLGCADTLVLVGAASLSTIVPSGPAFLGTLQFACALAIEFAGGTRAVGIAVATLLQLCLMAPVALLATLFLIHGSGNVIYTALAWKRAHDNAIGR